MTMPNAFIEAAHGPYDRCDCGRLMQLILGVDALSPDGIQVFWCAGCGVVNIHYNNDSGDTHYEPRPELIGIP